MKLSQVAAQLYTVRDHCRTAGELADAARKIRAIGYTAVQLSGLGPIPDHEIIGIMAGEGLTICATHEPGEDILDRPKKCIERLQRLGCQITAYPFPREVDLTRADHIRSLISKLDSAGALFRAAGLRLAYHNHAMEFIKFEGRTILEKIYAETKPENLAAELDTFWIHYGGGEIIPWCRKMAGRLPTIHLKDYGVTKENTHQWCELGVGTLDFPNIIAEAERSGCQWFIVEQDTCPADPFESLKISYQYLKDNIAQA